MARVGLITDIEGTTSSLAFVRDELFPFARARLRDFLAARGGEPEVARELDAVRAEAPGEPPEDVLERWMAEDRKATPLKTLQGLLWADGYATGALVGHVYPDVPPALAALRAAGVRLFVYSSGSVAAQRLLFGHTASGDLRPLFDGWFDTRVGPKVEAASYAAIAADVGLARAELWFVSDAVRELDAARGAGLRTLSVRREGTAPVPGHPLLATFDEIVPLVVPG